MHAAFAAGDVVRDARLGDAALDRERDQFVITSYSIHYTKLYEIVRFGGDAARAAKVYEGTEPLTPDDIAESIFWVVTLPKSYNFV